MKKILTGTAYLFLIILINSGISYPQFIYDQEDNLVENAAKKNEAKQGAFSKNIAFNIKAEIMPGQKNYVRITWETNPEYQGEFILGRSDLSIDTPDRAYTAKSVHVSNAAGRITYLDRELVPGKYYYAILAKESVQKREIELFKDVNYISNPVIIEEEKKSEYSGVRNIKAKTVQGGIEITWEPPAVKGENIKGYAVYRLDMIIDNSVRLKMAEHLTTIESGDSVYFDKITKTGKYYFAVLAKFVSGDVDLNLKSGQNYTSDPAEIAEFYQITSIQARGDGRNVVIIWDYSGTSGDKFFRIFRSDKKIEKLSDVDDGSIIGLIDVTGRYFKNDPAPDGSFYYGIVPKAEKGDFKLNPGVNITTHRISRSDIIKFEKKVITKKPSGKTDELDIILQRTFYRGMYRLAIKELQNIVDRSDNQTDRARAKLYIGRSYMETGDNRRALAYILLPEVKKHYPLDAKFWSEVAIIQVK